MVRIRLGIVGTVILIVLFVILLTIQINQPPFERYPNWDFFWVDTRIADRLVSLQYAISDLEVPSISPYGDFGWNTAGEPTDVVSFLSPANLLTMVFPLEVALALRTMLFLFLGGIGAYWFLQSITNDRFSSFLGGLTYVSVPFTISMHYQEGINAVFYSIPIFLLLIHKILEEKNARYHLLLVALVIFIVGASDIHAIVVIPSVVGAYAFLITYRYYHLSLARSLKETFFLTFLCVLASSFYILPLYGNLRTISSAMDPIREMGLYRGPLLQNPQSFLDFFYRYGIQTLYKPIEGSKFLLYVPVCFYFAIAVSLVFRRVVFKEHSRQAAIPATLVALGLLMFCISLSFYSLPPGLSAFGQGVLRYHINLIPFVAVLAGFICFAATNRLEDFKKEVYLLIFIGSFAVDWLLFGVAYPYLDSDLFAVRHAVQSGSFQSSNWLPVRFTDDMWLVLPWLNLLLVALLFLHSFVKTINRAHLRHMLEAAFVACAMILPLVSISLHNELRATQQAEWQRVTRSSYRWDSYLKRKACIDKIIDRHDPNYRTLPAGANVFGNGTGRNWKLIAETELNVQDREKVLFSYRETMHPYTALLYSTFAGWFRSANFMPPLSTQVAGNIETVRLMGVKWIVSADEKINDLDLIYRGECASQAPPDKGAGGEGIVYIYEVRNPTPIAFLTDTAKEMSLPKSLMAVFQNKDHPWHRSIVYIEEPPADVSGPLDGFIGDTAQNMEDKAGIVGETFSSISIKVSTQTQKYLVLSYIYRLDWKAYLGSEELKIYRAYGGFMAVQVPPGNYTVKFRYTPVDVYWGLILTALAFLIPVVACWRRPFWEPVDKRIETLTSKWNATLVTLISNRGIRLIAIALILCLILGLYAWFGPLAQMQLLDQAMNNLRLDVDFSIIATEETDTYVIARTGQKVKVDGPARLVEGPRPGSQALLVTNDTRLSGPPSALNLSEGSLAIWARLTDPGKDYSDLVRVNNNNDLYIYHQASGSFVVFYNGVNLGSTSMTVTDSNWHNYVLTWRDMTVNFYVDGHVVLRKWTPAATAEVKTFAIGWLGDRDGEQWSGPISELALFDRALTQDEVMAVYQASLPTGR